MQLHCSILKFTSHTLGIQLPKRTKINKEENKWKYFPISNQKTKKKNPTKHSTLENSQVTRNSNSMILLTVQYLSELIGTEKQQKKEERENKQSIHIRSLSNNNNNNYYYQ